MQLLELMVAASVFTAASAGSLQVFAQAASSSQASELQQQQLERIELDRLRLQALWRRQLEGSSACDVTPQRLRELAASVQPPPQLERELLLAEQPGELRLRWRFEDRPAVVRERLVTPAGLGLACPASSVGQEEIAP